MATNDECVEAELGEVLTYLKRSQYIDVSPEWWPYVFPPAGMGR